MKILVTLTLFCLFCLQVTQVLDASPVRQAGCNELLSSGTCFTDDDPCANKEIECPYGCIPCGDCKSILKCITEPLHH